MGFKKDYRPRVTIPAETLGSTSGKIGTWPPVTVITATATGLVYQLPIPRSGLQKTVIVKWTGDTGNLTIANKSTGTVFNGTSANVITVSSSQNFKAFNFVGISTSQWAVTWSEQPTTSSGSGDVLSFVRFAASAVTS